MDRIIQRLFTIILLSLSLTSFGQCDKNYISVDSSECGFVIMSPYKFTEFYQAKKNLDIIRLQMPELKQKVDSLKRVNYEIQHNYIDQVDTMRATYSILEQSYSECVETAVELSIENDYLIYQNNKLKKNRWKLVAGGAALAVVVNTVIKVLVR